MITSATASTRELHSRVSDGIDVRLLWRADNDCLFVTVTDTKHHEELWIEVRDQGRALDVFHHPYAYAAHQGVQTQPTRPPVYVSLPVSR